MKETMQQVQGRFQAISEQLDSQNILFESCLYSVYTHVVKHITCGVNVKLCPVINTSVSSET